MGAIVLTPELDWMEAGFSRSVKILNNSIRRSGVNPSIWSTIQAGVITVAAEGDSGFAPAGGHWNIEITGNRIDSSLGANILATSVTKLTIQDNVMVNTHSELRNHGRNRGINPEAAVVLINCEDVSLNRNLVSNFGGDEILATNLTNPPGEGAFTSQPATFSNYQLLYEVGGLDEDDDLDLVPNIHEYILGRNPTVMDNPEPLQWVQVDAGTPSFNFLYPTAGRSDIQIHVQTSSTLQPDDWTSVVTRTGIGAWPDSVSLNTNPGSTEQHLEEVEISGPIPANGALFYRLLMEVESLDQSTE